MSLREILELLDIFGHDELVTKLKASDVRVDGQTLYVNSPFDIDTDVQLEEDLTKALKSIVGEKWRASVLPF